jgi:hypothetical protein
MPVALILAASPAMRELAAARAEMGQPRELGTRYMMEIYRRNYQQCATRPSRGYAA